MKSFAKRAEAKKALRKMRGWPERRVICLYVPGNKKADLTGHIYCVEAEPGRFLQEDGGVG
ncbi:hypothetical protein ES703_70248 [subsurface metagenome]